MFDSLLNLPVRSFSIITAADNSILHNSHAVQSAYTQSTNPWHNTPFCVHYNESHRLIKLRIFYTHIFYKSINFVYLIIIYMYFLYICAVQMLFICFSVRVQGCFTYLNTRLFIACNLCIEVIIICSSICCKCDSSSWMLVSISSYHILDITSPYDSSLFKRYHMLLNKLKHW